jgi:hypothetical protein
MHPDVDDVFQFGWLTFGKDGLTLHGVFLYLVFVSAVLTQRTHERRRSAPGARKWRGDAAPPRAGLESAD